MSITTASGAKITGDMLLIDVVAICPPAEAILKTWGLHCVGCSGSALETLSDGVRSHGFGDEEIGAMLEDINTAFNEAPEMPCVVTITEEAARGFADIAKSEGKTNCALRIVTDGRGGFCLEFEDGKSDDPSFSHAEVPEVTVRVSPLILRRVGGSVIDKKNGRFALELKDDVKVGCGCRDGGECGCKNEK